MFIPTNGVGYKYKITFQPALESSHNSDNHLKELEDLPIIMLQKDYKIIEAIHQTTNSMTLKFLGGIQSHIEEGETKTYYIDGQPYKIQAQIITDNEDLAKVNIRFIVNDKKIETLQKNQTIFLRQLARIYRYKHNKYSL